MKKLNLLALSIALMLIYSCQKEAPSTNITAEIPKTDVEELGKKVVIGKSWKIPIRLPTCVGH